MSADFIEPAKDEPPANSENIPSNNTEESAHSNVMKKCKRQKHYLSQQKQRKNNKNWKLNKFKRQQSEKMGIEIQVKTFDKNVRRFNNAPIKFNKNILGRPRLFPVLSKFFLPEKRPRKDLIVPPTKFLLGGNISDPLNLNSLQNIEDDLLNATPKSSPLQTPPKIEVIIPPNIHDPLHLMDPVDAIEYQKQLTSPVKRKKRSRNRNKKRKSECESPTQSEKLAIENNIADMVKENSLNADHNTSGEKSETDTSYEEKNLEAREKVLRDLKLELSLDGASRKRRISETHSIGKCKVRRMDSMDKIVSPVVPQPGAWKRPPRPIPSGAPRGGTRNRCRSQSQSLTDDPSPTDEVNKNLSACESDVSLNESDNKTFEPNVIVNSSTDAIGAGIESGGAPKKIVFKKSDSKYQYGNYDRYNGYRNLNEFMDVRLNVFKKYPHLFYDKDVLDIGCNAGHITISVAKDLKPKTVTGIDIDPILITKGIRNLSLYVKIMNSKPTETSQNTNKISKETTTKTEEDGIPTTSSSNLGAVAANHKPHRRGKRSNKKPRMESATMSQHPLKPDEYFPVSFPKCYGQIPDIKLLSDCEPSNARMLFPDNVFFKTCNYVLKDDSQLILDSQQYDLILCLSMTKWIHLNFGDSGLKLAFKRMFNQLRPGGKLILEAQNWASYKKKKKLTETIFNNYKSIEFYPNKFHEYLLGPDVGFSHSYPLGIPRHLSKGFKRPIQLYVKGDFTPSQICWSDAYHPQTPYEPYRGIYAETIQPNKTVWGNETPLGNSGNFSYRFTPSQNLSSTSQYYNPYETDSYLPSYNSEIQKRQYCFASPLYSTVWSPPSGRKSAPHTPVYGSNSTRENDTTDDHVKPKHVYPPTEEFDVGKMSQRSADETTEKSPNVHVYAGTSDNDDVSSPNPCDVIISHIEKTEE